MKVMIPKYSGFCPGVKKAEERLMDEKKQTKSPIFIYGQLIHNTHYIDFLEKQGLKTLENLEKIPANEKLVIRTHGIPKQVEEKIAKNHDIIDLTCYTVKKLQLKIQGYSEKGFFLVLTGKKDHPEVQGLISYSKGFYVIESLKDTENNLSSIEQLLNQGGFRKILVASQTTGEKILFDSVCGAVKNKFSPLFEVILLNSICPITSLREQEALKLQKEVDVTFVIGDKKSSNTKKIFDVLKNENQDTYFVEDLDSLIGLNLPLKKYNKAQIVSSSSTPAFIDSEIVEYLEKI